MAIEFVQAGVSAVTATSTRTVTLNGVTAGNLIVAVVFWEGPTTTVSVSDGTSSFTVGNAGVNPDTIDGEWDIRQCVAYLLSANSGNKTYTLTLGAARQTVALHVLEFSGDHDWSLDGQASYGYGRGTTETSGSLTTTGTNVVCVGWGRMWASGGYSSQTIGGSTATEATDNGGYSGYTAYRIATLSSGTAVATSSNQYWLSGLVAFNSDGGGGNPHYYYAQQ